MRLDCCVITTNLHHRLHLLENLIQSLNKFEFDNKIISVDEFQNGEGSCWFQKFPSWSMVYKPVDHRRSMILNQRQAVTNTGSEVVLYSEDDIVVNNLPSRNTLEKLFFENILGKPVGFISFNNHVYFNFNENPPHIINYINNLDNYITINDDVFLKKSPVIKDDYYWNFPVAIFNRQLFLDVQDYALVHKIGFGAEPGMTSAFFDMGKDKEFEVLISLKKDVLEDIKSGKLITVAEFYKYANINFWNNDETLRHASINGRGNTIF